MRPRAEARSLARRGLASLSGFMSRSPLKDCGPGPLGDTPKDPAGLGDRAGRRPAAWGSRTRAPPSAPYRSRRRPAARSGSRPRRASPVWRSRAAGAAAAPRRDTATPRETRAAPPGGERPPPGVACAVNEEHARLRSLGKLVLRAPAVQGGQLRIQTLRAPWSGGAHTARRGSEVLGCFATPGSRQPSSFALDNVGVAGNVASTRIRHERSPSRESLRVIGHREKAHRGPGLQSRHWTAACLQPQPLLLQAGATGGRTSGLSRPSYARPRLRSCWGGPWPGPAWGCAAASAERRGRDRDDGRRREPSGSITVRSRWPSWA